MKRGEIWTVAGGGAYTGKPRPCVIIQDDAFDATQSVTICAMTTDSTEAPLFRIRVEPDDANGLRTTSNLMVDKITTVPKDRIGSRVGQLRDEDLFRLNQAMIVFLGLAASAKSKS
jgi:mRNA interferase MazF